MGEIRDLRNNLLGEVEPDKFLGEPYICVCGENEPVHKGVVNYHPLCGNAKWYIRYTLNKETEQAVLGGRTGTVVLTNDICKGLNLDEEQVIADALENMKKWGYKMKSMTKHLEELTGIPAPGPIPTDNVYVIELNADLLYGSGVMAVPCFLEEIRGKVGDYYILPSTIHELIIVPMNDENMPDVEELKMIVKEVNHTTIKAGDFFTNDTFIYNHLGLSIA